MNLQFVSARSSHLAFKALLCERNVPSVSTLRLTHEFRARCVPGSM